ncbi:MAG: glycoside hydrolase family 127 protein [Bacteroidales bacterium]|nr:glycoside hydrolase family 127 protein [Bacteroidales bacterium]
MASRTPEVTNSGCHLPNCCPPNVARLIAALTKYIYEKSEEDIWVNLFIGSALQTSVGDMGVTIEQETGYPPDGNYMPEDIRWYETGIIEWQVSR